MDSGKKDKKKSSPWREDEILFLLELVSDNYSVINSNFGPGVTTESKRLVWQSVADSLKAQGFPRFVLFSFGCRAMLFKSMDSMVVIY